MNNKITLQELAAALAAHKDITKKMAEAFIRHTFDIIEEYALMDGQVKIKGFGTFKIVGVESRESVNVNTGERVLIEGHSKLTFTPDAVLRDQVNKPFADFTTVLLNPGTSLEEMEAIDEEEEEVVEEEDAQIEETQQPEVQPEPEAETPVQEPEPVPVEVEQEEEEEPEETEENPIIMQEEQKAVNHIEHQTIEQMNVGSQYVTNQTIQQMVANAVHQELASRREVLVPKRMLVWMSVLFIALLCAAFYGGYYMGSRQPKADVVQPKADVVQPKDDVVQPKAEPAETEAAQPAAKPAEPAEQQPKAAEEKPQPAPQKPNPDDVSKRAAKYDQMPGGEYLIVGTKGVHIMSRGDNMYKIAKATYGDSKLADYIIFYNQFRNPDKVFLGAEVRLPELVKKQ